MRRLLGAVASTAGWLSLGAGAYLLFGPHTSSAFARIWFRRYL